MAAAAGKLLVLVGGHEDVVEYVHPVLASFGDPVVHLGPLGAGLLAKLINNALMTAQLGLADDALRIGTTLGLDSEALGAALQHGSGGSFSLGIRARMPEGLHQFGAGGLLRKDVDLLASVAVQRHADPGVLQLAAEALLGRLSPPA